MTPMTRTRTTVQRLGRIPVFRSLPADQLRKLTEFAAHRIVRPGDVLYRQGDPSSSCFVLLSGSVRLTVRLRGRNAIAGLAYGGELFGLESLRPRRKRPETTTATGATALLEFDSDLMKEILADNPDFQLRLLNYVVEKLNEKTVHALRTGHYDAEQRIAAYLIHQGGHAASGECESSKVLSQAELADYLALTPETFCRKVSKFRRLGWIGGNGNQYVIKHHDALRELLEQ